MRSLEPSSVVIAANKSDLVESSKIRQRTEQLRGFGMEPVIPISALSGEGIDRLRSVLEDRLGGCTSTSLGQAVLVSERQRAAMDEASAALDRGMDLCRSARETIDCAEVLAFEIRYALDALGTVTGAVTTEDLLGQVFAKFCIGK